MLLIITGSILILISLILFYLADTIKIEKDQKQENYHKNLKRKNEQLKQDINSLFKEKDQIKKNIENDLHKWNEQRTKEIEQQVKNKQELANKIVQQAEEKAKKTVAYMNADIEAFEEKNNLQKIKILEDIEKIKSFLNAGVEAQLRYEAAQNEIKFYKLQVEPSDLEDIQKLESLKSTLHKPVVLSKLIWSQYFQKQMNALCDRVLGKNTVCGIYKITNQLNKKCYIGQSIDIARRWKDHCKCGLGIDAPSTNQLYNAMQKDGVWNFSFELIEKCQKEYLNEKEKLWIEMYSSDKFGYNGTSGNQKGVK